MPTAKETLISQLNDLSVAINTKANETGNHTIEQMTAIVTEIPTEKPEESEIVDLDLSEGSQVVTPQSGYVLNQVTIRKPETLEAENIKKDVEIAGVTGTFEGGVTPQLEGIYQYYDGALEYKAELPSSGENYGTIYQCGMADSLLKSIVYQGEIYSVSIGSGVQLKEIQINEGFIYAEQDEYEYRLSNISGFEGSGMYYVTGGASGSFSIPEGYDNVGLYNIRGENDFVKLEGYTDPGLYYVDVGGQTAFSLPQGYSESAIYYVAGSEFERLDAGYYNIGSDGTYSNLGSIGIIPEEYDPLHSGYLFSCGSDGPVASPALVEVETEDYVSQSTFNDLEVGDSFTMVFSLSSGMTYQVTRLT